MEVLEGFSYFCLRDLLLVSFLRRMLEPPRQLKWSGGCLVQKVVLWEGDTGLAEAEYLRNSKCERVN